MRPVVNGLEDEYGNQIDFQQHNIASPSGEAWANNFSLRGHPAYILLDSNGLEQWRSIGVIPKEQIEAEIQAVLQEE